MIAKQDQQFVVDVANDHCVKPGTQGRETWFPVEAKTTKSCTLATARAKTHNGVERHCRPWFLQCQHHAFAAQARLQASAQGKPPNGCADAAFLVIAEGVQTRDANMHDMVLEKLAPTKAGQPFKI